MDTNQEIRDFLTTRRARLTPKRASLPGFGRARRVPRRRLRLLLPAGDGLRGAGHSSRIAAPCGPRIGSIHTRTICP